jgi:tetratricopeptide (TPR) repeat protein
VTGLFILTAAASRDHRWAWWVHVSGAALVLGGYAAHRIVSYARPPAGRPRRFVVAVVVGVAALLSVHVVVNRGVRLTPEARLAMERGLDRGPGGKARDVSEFAPGGFVPQGFVPPESPFFPSAATTTTGGSLPARIITRSVDPSRAEEVRRQVRTEGFATDVLIGAETCERCHPDVVEQWAGSAHRFASFNNPFYEASLNDLRENATASNEWIASHIESLDAPEVGVGRIKSKWCGGCHDPALMLAGAMESSIDRERVEAQAGLTCLACHAIDAIHDRTGDGNYNIADEQEDPYLFADAEPGSWQAFLHDAAVKAKPTVHMRQLLKDFFRTSEYCATCHKVSIPEPVNNYRWLRAQNEYDNWHDSGVSWNASRTFYLPPAPRVCQDCHMPPEPAPLGDLAAEDGRVRSHRFLAVNTALPFVRGDTATIRMIETFLRDGKLSVDIFALRREGEEGPLMGAPDAWRLRAGESITVEVVVRNRGVGHTFPGGTNDSNEGWLEFSVVDDEGRVIALSGDVLDDGRLDPMAHVYKAVILDREGEPILKRNAQDIYVTAASNVIGPGTADVAHYTLTVPPGLVGRRIALRARLLWRKFTRPYTEFAFETNPDGFKRFAEPPDLPITEIAAAAKELEILPTVDGVTVDGVTGDQARTAAALPVDSTTPSDSADWERFNDYGIALLLEGNTRAAAGVFREVMRLQPGRIDGPLNLARVSLSDGNLEAAYEALQLAEQIAPGDPRSAWVWGGVLQEDGRYTESVQAYERVLETFPQDRGAWLQMGRTLYLDQRYEQALVALARVLEIDPEDRVAHYHRMLSLRALGRDADADLAEAAYERYRIDESAQAVTRSYRSENPGVNLMAQPIHTHPVTLRPAVSETPRP